MAQVVKKEFRHAVNGITITTFERGTPASKLPPDTLAYAERAGLLGEGKAVDVEENKAVDTAPENKSKRGK